MFGKYLIIFSPGDNQFTLFCFQKSYIIFRTWKIFKFGNVFDRTCSGQPEWTMMIKLSNFLKRVPNKLQYQYCFFQRSSTFPSETKSDLRPLNRTLPHKPHQFKSLPWKTPKLSQQIYLPIFMKKTNQG